MDGWLRLYIQKTIAHKLLNNLEKNCLPFELFLYFLRKLYYLIQYISFYFIIMRLTMIMQYLLNSLFYSPIKPGVFGFTSTL